MAYCSDVYCVLLADAARELLSKFMKINATGGVYGAY
jgi:hypothetical protein